MPPQTVILDFDGTCTDVEQEAQGFLTAYKQDLAQRLGRDSLDDAWAAAEAEVLAHPHRHGMVMDGSLVAPPVDLYLLATAVSAVLAPDLDDATTEALFRDNYRFTTCCFKPETKAVLEQLVAGPWDLHIVTNSEPTAVGEKLDALAPAGRDAIQLHGNARKFLVADPVTHAGHAWFERVPEEIRVDQWDRQVLPRRGHYFDALASIWSATETTPEQTLVIGDVYELDLALPAALGCGVHLVESPRTLAYERAAVREAGGTHHPDLAQVHARL